MKNLSIVLLSISIAFLSSCNQISPDANFGAYYTKVQSEEAFEQFSRTGDYSDIVVDLGEKNGRLVFWRGSSFLPYWQGVNGEIHYLPELISRSGNGESHLMPDKVNTYTHVKIIENTPVQVVIHWRYIKSFTGGNPDLDISPGSFVDEYFTIYPDGEVERKVRDGKDKADEWNNPGNLIKQTITLIRNGISEGEIENSTMLIDPLVVQGAELIADISMDPVLSFGFDEGIGEKTSERINNKLLGVKGRKVLWRKGVSGTALQFDGYNTEIRMDKALDIKDEISLQAYVALGAYPWSWCPIIQQCNDVPEEIESGRKNGKYFVELVKENDTGFFLGINGDGNPGLKIRVDGKWQELTSNIVLDRRQWYLITGTYSSSTGLMNIYVDGKIAAKKRIGSGDIELSDSDILIGRGKPRRPINPVRQNTFPGQFAFDGLIDEVKVYDVALAEDEIIKYSENASAKTRTIEMDKRVLPAGSREQKFGAYYDHLNFYDIWDNLWCFSEHPDIVVGFDDNPSKFVFWRGVSYIPMMVNEKGQWYSNEFNETWGTSGGDGCQEPMSDKGNYFTYARILENTPARVVVHYRFPLADVNLVKANLVEETGWYDVADWYYYIYPDGIATKQKHLWTSGERNHEWQESMAIFGPDQHPEQIIEKRNTVTMKDMDDNSMTYHWTAAPPPNVDEPENQCIQIVNYTGDYDPITIGEAFEGSNVYGGELTPYSVFPTWNHWPVAQMPSDGRYASFADRTGHSSLTHVYLPVYDEAEGDRPFYEKLLMEAMLKTEETDLVKLAKSWNHAPEIELKGEGKAWFEKPERAYYVEDAGNEVEVEIMADRDHPVHNLILVVKNWGRQEASEVMINGKNIGAKQGIVRDTDGSYKLVIWLEMMSDEGIKLAISG